MINQLVGGDSRVYEKRPGNGAVNGVAPVEIISSSIVLPFLLKLPDNTNS
jgi:hypothetical protein